MSSIPGAGVFILARFVLAQARRDAGPRLRDIMHPSKVALDGAFARRPSREDAGAVARITTFHQPTLSERDDEGGG